MNGQASGIGAVNAAVVRQMADDLRAIRRGLEEVCRRTEFGAILAGLRARGLITQADVERLERDGMKEVDHA